jgi:leucyl aminopeptidase (aminopeptidase T)
MPAVREKGKGGVDDLIGPVFSDWIALPVQQEPDMNDSTHLIELIKNVGIVFDLNTRAGESVLIVTDSMQDLNIWMAIAAAGRAHGCEITIVMMADPRESHRTPPPRTVIAAMETADVTISATSKEFHTGGHFVHATDRGHRFIIMEGVTSEILTGPFVKADYRLMNEVGPALKEVMDRGGRWHIRSESGTDFTCQVKPNTGRWMAAKADASNNGWGLPMAAFPDGEFGASPVRGTGEGVVVWDTSVHYPRGLLRQAISLTIHEGRVVKIEGGVEAQQLIQFITEHSVGKNDEFDIELSIGFNPKCPLTGVLRTDKKHYGKIHTAIGDDRKGQLHVDGVTRKPTITIENQPIVKNGVILIPPLDTWA